MSNPNRLTTKEVARICRVSDATIKRWAAAGLIRSEKTNGGHRRFLAEDIAAFRCTQRLGVGHQTGDNSLATSSARTRAKKIPGCSEFLRALICGCEEEVAALLIKRYLDGESLEALFDNIIAVEMRTIGRLWVQGKISVAEEHLASRCVSYALFKLRTVMIAEEQNLRLAVCSGLEGDHHGLGTELSRLVFESLGWSVINFGPNTPFFSLQSGIENNDPEAICISGSMIFDIERLNMDYSRFTHSLDGSHTKLILGGRAFRENGIRERFPADFYPTSFQNLAEMVRSF